MPIYEALGMTVVHFGYGDIVVNLARSGDTPYGSPENELVLVRDTPHAVGEYTSEYEGKRGDEVDAPVRIVFDNPESVDVLIERLERVKENMQRKYRKSTARR